MIVFTPSCTVPSTIEVRACSIVRWISERKKVVRRCDTIRKIVIDAEVCIVHYKNKLLK